MSVVVLILLVSATSIGFVLGRMSCDDRQSAGTHRRKASREKVSARPQAHPFRVRSQVDEREPERRPR